MGAFNEKNKSTTARGLSNVLTRFGFKNDRRNFMENGRRRTQRGWNIDKKKLTLLKLQYGFVSDVSDVSDESATGDGSKLDLFLQPIVRAQ